MTDTGIPLDWQSALGDVLESNFSQALRSFLRQELQAGRTVFPEKDRWFEALRLTPFDQVRVVIVGQDPYHTPGMAHGLAFSVQEGCRLPLSLQNIFKELQNDLGGQLRTRGDLSDWARQGVLLLNTSLTVRAHEAASHAGQGWEAFTQAIVTALATTRENLVFILWGAHAQRVGAAIDPAQHLVIKSSHPSPFSAHKGTAAAPAFFGSHPFSRTNEYLRNHTLPPIKWSASEEDIYFSDLAEKRDSPEGKIIPHDQAWE